MINEDALWCCLIDVVGVDSLSILESMLKVYISGCMDITGDNFHLAARRLLAGRLGDRDSDFVESGGRYIKMSGPMSLRGRSSSVF
jgi:hypothetical protein